MNNKKMLMKKIKEYDFALKELNLYLDTHPNCCRALAMFQKYKTLRDAAVNDYIRSYGPITPEQSENAQHWDWIDNPFPWEV